MYDYLDKPVFVQLKNNGGSFSGTLTGFDVFQNLVLANSTDESHHKLGAKVPMGEIVRFVPQRAFCSFLLLFNSRRVC